MTERKYILIAALALFAAVMIAACKQAEQTNGNTNAAAPPPTNTTTAPADNTTAAADNSSVGDVVMSVLGLAEFRRNRGDNGPNYKWYPSNGDPMPVDVGGLKNSPNFQGRYPRGASVEQIPDLATGENGAVGTTVAQAIQNHKHTTTWGMSGFDDDGDPGRKAAVFQGANMGNGTETTSLSGGGAETRPNSVVMYFYIRVR